MTTKNNSTVATTAATVPAALALIAEANARQAVIKRQEAQAALDKVTAAWGGMTISEIREAVKVNLPIMTEEEGEALKAMAEEAIKSLQLAEKVNREYKQALRLSTPEGVEKTISAMVTEDGRQKAADEIARAKKTQQAADAAKKAKITAIIADYGDTLTENQKRAMSAFLNAPSCKWSYNPTEEGRSALLRAVARAARAIREQAKK